MSSERVLVVDDKDTMLSLFARLLQGKDVVTARDGAEALALIASEERFDVIVSDIRMPGMDGLALLEESRRRSPDTPFILMTAYSAVPDAVHAMKVGAFDYLVKPFDPDEAVVVIEKALELRRLKGQAQRLREELDRAHGFGSFVGDSPVMRNLYTRIDKAAAADSNVLVLGESGTGKELAARAIHARSARRDFPFLAVNCGALPEALAESELFGHAKGAFTGASVEKPGLFEEAQGGTVFLDEIASLPLSLQVKLNRALEEHEARRVGKNTSYRVDARIIAAANVDLKSEVSAGRFREDLYFRLHVLVIRMPSLREHREDIPLLAASFLDRFGRQAPRKELASDALKALLAYGWPGNVRELRNAIESGIAVCEGDRITLADLPQEVRAGTLEDIPFEHLARLKYDEACRLGRDQMARRYLVALMKSCQGNVTNAADAAGVERESLHRLLRRHGVDPAAFRK